MKQTEQLEIIFVGTIDLESLPESEQRIEAHGIDKATFIGDYEMWMRKKKQRRKT